jgi:hypothetical protein
VKYPVSSVIVSKFRSALSYFIFQYCGAFSSMMSYSLDVNRGIIFQEGGTGRCSTPVAYSRSDLLWDFLAFWFPGLVFYVLVGSKNENLCCHVIKTGECMGDCLSPNAAYMTLKPWESSSLKYDSKIPEDCHTNSCSLLTFLHLHKALEGLKKLQPIFGCSDVKILDVNLDSILIFWKVRASN